ncbi:MAG: RNA polymerase sigma factor [Planctomycetes bacterium]|nr:RNA polymerase sigma factor [Planctomycetota bacterium]
MKTADSHRRFDAHREKVYGWAYRLLRNHHDALDVTQEVFIKWWSAQLKNALPENPIGWLRRVTVNQAIDAARAAARPDRVPRPFPGLGSDADGAPHPGAHPSSTLREVETPTAVTNRSPSGEIELRELADAVADAMATLSEKQRAVLFAKVYDGCTFTQIAEQMQVSVPTVKTHYLRAIRAMGPKLIEAGVRPGDGHELR